MMITVYRAIDLLLMIIEYAILARVIISWVPVPKDNQFIRLLYQVTEPVLAPIRGLIERSAMGRNMMIDFSPIIAFILINIVRNVIRRMLLGGYWMF
ncbi:MAG: YggT family protein [Clostridia bacterium]|nr:YggT family protein [Clostridia bacterium]